MDILGPLPKTSAGNQFVFAMNDRYSRLTRAVPVSKTTASRAALTIIDNWIMPYGIPNFLLTDSGQQFVRKFFNALCSILGIKQLTTTAVHCKHSRTERYNKTIVARLHQYVNEHLSHWDLFAQSLTYGTANKYTDLQG